MINNNKKQNSYIKHYTNKLLLILATFFILFGVANAGTVSDSSGVLTYDSVNICMADGSTQFTGNVNFGGNEINNVSNLKISNIGYRSGNYPTTRKLFLDDYATTTYTVCDSGCDYTLINDAITNYPIFQTYQTRINVLAPYTAKEDVYVPMSILSSDTSTSDGAMLGLKISGNCSNINEIEINSAHIIGNVGALTPELTCMKITGRDPHADENVSVAVFGSRDATLQAINFSGANAKYPILAYASGVSVAGVDLGNDYVGGFVTKHTGFFHFEISPENVPGWNSTYNAIGSVSDYPYINFGGIPFGVLENNVSGGKGFADARRAPVYDMNNNKAYGITSFDDNLTDLTIDNGNAIFRSLSGGGYEIYNPSASQTYLSLNRGGSTLDLSLDSTSFNIDATGKKLALKTSGNTRVTIATDKNVMNINPQSTAPSTCVIGDNYVDTSGAFCFCGAINSWENLASTGTCS